MVRLDVFIRSQIFHAATCLGRCDFPAGAAPVDVPPKPSLKSLHRSDLAHATRIGGGRERFELRNDGADEVVGGRRS
jgi:hypothetical protein